MELSENLSYLASKRIFVRPNIPRDKLANALASYGPQAQPEDIIILLDDTLWGGAREGIMVTNKRIYAKELGNCATCVAFSRIGEIRLERKSIFIDSSKFFTFNIPDAVDVNRAVMFIRELIEQTKSLKEENEQIDSVDGEENCEDNNETVNDLSRKNAEWLSYLPDNGSNFFMELQGVLCPEPQTPPIVNFAEDFWDKMLAVSVAPSDEDFHDRLLSITTYKMLAVALCYPDYINQDQQMPPRLIKYLKNNELLSFELVTYVLARMQIILARHISQEETCNVLEPLFSKTIINYVRYKSGPTRPGTIASLRGPSEEEIRDNPLIKLYCERFRLHVRMKDNEPEGFLSHYITHAITEDLERNNLAENIVKKIVNSSYNLYGKNFTGLLPEYADFLDRQSEKIMYSLLSQLQ